MPFGDGTGPMGLGPMTGRAAGYCAGYGRPGYLNPIYGRFGYGRGFGGGYGRGYRHWYWATGLPGWARTGWGAYPMNYNVPYAGSLTAEQELEILKNQAKSFQQALDNVNKRIEELEKQNEES